MPIAGLPDRWSRYGRDTYALINDVVVAGFMCDSSRIAIIRGEESALMTDDVDDYMRKLLGHQVPFISIPHARHHVMLDQPLAFISALPSLFAEWPHSDPHREI